MRKEDRRKNEKRMKVLRPAHVFNIMAGYYHIVLESYFLNVKSDTNNNNIQPLC